MKKLFALFKLMRPLNLFQGAIAVLVTTTFFPQMPAWWRILIGIGIVSCYSGAGNSLNDFCDYQIDCINRPNRPLPAGLVKRSTALYFAIILFIVGSLLAIPVGSLGLLLIMALALILLITYSLIFKRLPFLGNFVVAAILGMAFIFSATLFGDWRIGLPPAFLAFGFNLIREIVKDMQDVQGDEAVGARTLPIKYGLKNARSFVVGAIIILIIVTIIPYWMGIYGKYYLWVVLIAVNIPLLYAAVSIYHDYSSQNCGRLARLLKGDVFFGLLAIYLGRF